MSRDFDANKAFYQAVFGYQYDDMSGDGFSYATFRTTGNELGGIGDLGSAAPGTPGHWHVYFGVADADDAVASAAQMGGAVVRPAWDTPYGRMATLADDQGAVFAVMALAQASDQ